MTQREFDDGLLVLGHENRTRHEAAVVEAGTTSSVSDVRDTRNSGPERTGMCGCVRGEESEQTSEACRRRQRDPSSFIDPSTPPATVAPTMARKRHLLDGLRDAQSKKVLDTFGTYHGKGKVLDIGADGK